MIFDYVLSGAVTVFIAMLSFAPNASDREAAAIESPIQ